MLFIALLLLGFAATVLVRPGRRLPVRDRWRLALALGMAAAGASHLLMPEPFLQHLPEWTPAREALVVLSGIVEILLGIGLLTPLRETTGRALALFLLAVWPANVHVAVAGVDVQGQPGGVYPWLRIPLQLVFIWLAWWSTQSAKPPAVGRWSTLVHKPVGNPGISSPTVSE